ncbi:hypothetical protein PG984_012862 [Apiospora sp. TS-2023a]
MKFELEQHVCRPPPNYCSPIDKVCEFVGSGRVPQAASACDTMREYIRAAVIVVSAPLEV